MKNNLLLILLFLISAPLLFGQVTTKLLINNEHSIGSDYFFDIYMYTTANSIGNALLFGGDIGFTFDNTKFSNITFNKVYDPNPPVVQGITIQRGYNTFVSTNYPDPTDPYTQLFVSKSTFDKTYPTVINNYDIIINLFDHIAFDSTALYDKIPSIDMDSTLHCLGRFQLGGYLGGDVNLALKECHTESFTTYISCYKEDGSYTVYQTSETTCPVVIPPVDTTITNPPIDTTVINPPIDTTVIIPPVDSIADGECEVRFILSEDYIPGEECLAYAILQIKAKEPGKEFYLGDQEYFFHFNSSMVENYDPNDSLPSIWPEWQWGLVTGDHQLEIINDSTIKYTVDPPTSYSGDYISADNWENIAKIGFDLDETSPNDSFDLEWVETETVINEIINDTLALVEETVYNDASIFISCNEITTGTSAGELRFSVEEQSIAGLDCMAYVSIEIKAKEPGKEFYLGDQEYLFHFDNSSIEQYDPNSTSPSIWLHYQFFLGNHQLEIINDSTIKYLIDSPENYQGELITADNWKYIARIGIDRTESSQNEYFNLRWNATETKILEVENGNLAFVGETVYNDYSNLMTCKEITTLGNGACEVRFSIEQELNNNCKLFSTIEVKASAPGKEFYLTDQEYIIQFNSSSVANYDPTDSNPSIWLEEEFMSEFQISNNSLFSYFHPHRLDIINDSTLSYTVDWLDLSSNPANYTGYLITSDEWTSIGKIGFLKNTQPNNSSFYLNWDTLQTVVQEEISDTSFLVEKFSYQDYYSYSFCYYALPIELTNFQGETIENKTNVLEWVTASEQNSSHFILQRKGDDTTWEDIGRIEAAGNSTQSINYNYSDQRPIIGNNYYRLLIQDQDGEFSYSEIIHLAILPNDNKLGLELFPNPASDEIFLRPNESTEIIRIVEIVTIEGKVVLQKLLSDTTSNTVINVKNLPAGIYFVQVHTSHNSYLKKLVKQ